MASAVKKPSSENAIAAYDAQFADIRSCAEDFNAYEAGGHDLLYKALEQLFTFGSDIRKREKIFEAFLKQHKLKLNKVTKENPYNALVELAFGNQKSKSWRSELSNVLAYASVDVGNAPFVDWIKEGGVKARYEQAVKYFSEKRGKKTNKLRSTQLAAIQADLQKAPLSPTPISGLPVLNQGFHRSLVYSDGTNTFLVDVKADATTGEVEKYLLELAKKRGTGTHPLQTRPLFNLFRAIDLIAGTCETASGGKMKFIRFRNSTSDDGTTTTKLDFVSDAYSFTHAAVTLAKAIPELGENATFVLDIEEAQKFVADFPSDPVWSIKAVGDTVTLVDDSNVKRTVALMPLQDDTASALRQGQVLKNPTRHFAAISAEMRQIQENLPALLGQQPAPKTISWEIQGKQMHLVSPENMLLRLDFLRPSSNIATIDEKREVSLANITAFIKAVIPYGEDMVGYIADSDVKNAAFCIDHQFVSGDQFRYVLPFVISTNLDTTEVCEKLP